jgi:hypothetical protein
MVESRHDKAQSAEQHIIRACIDYRMSTRPFNDLYAHIRDA